MKKWLMLLLCLVLCCPASLAEDTQDEIELTTMPLDFGDFVMTVFNVDGVQMGEKLDGEVWAVIYPLYVESDPFHDTINVVWHASDLTETVELMGVEFYAETLLQQTVEQYASLGIQATNAKLASALYEEGQMAMAYSIDMDYTAAGTDLKVTMWQLQQYVMLGEKGTYIFTLTTDSFEDLKMLTYYLSATIFPTEE